MQLSHSLILVTESSNMAPHGKELSEDLKRHIVALHDDGQGYKKIANTLKLSCSTVAKIIQHFKRVESTHNRPQVGHPKKLSAFAEHYIQMLSLKDRRRSAVCIAAEIEEVGVLSALLQRLKRGVCGGGVNLLVLRPYAALYIELVCMAVTPEGSLFWRRYTRKPPKQFAEDMSTKHMAYWNHVLWSDEMKINLFGSDGFKHVWWRPAEEYKDKCVMPTVKHGGGNVIV